MFQGDPALIIPLHPPGRIKKIQFEIVMVLLWENQVLVISTMFYWTST